MKNANEYKIVKKFAFIINDCFVSEGQRLSSSWNFL